MSDAVMLTKQGRRQHKISGAMGRGGGTIRKKLKHMIIL